MRRLAIKLVLFLLLGAIVNIAVAWGLAIVQPGRMQWRTDELSAVEECWLLDHGEQAANDVIEDIGPGRTVRQIHLADSQWDTDPKYASRPERPFFVWFYSVGTPSRSLSLVIWSHSRDWARNHGHPAVINKPPEEMQAWSVAGRLVPLRPLWPGFAVNTLFYAAVLWFIFAIPGGVKRLRRRAKGWCIHCGYDLRGASHDRCPECGKAVHGAAAPCNPRNESNA
jgi:hypothetical protein